MKIPVKKRKFVKLGQSFYYPIPIEYVRNGQLDPKKNYDIDIQKSRVEE
jgi:hypothetical protein